MPFLPAYSHGARAVITDALRRLSQVTVYRDRLIPGLISAATQYAQAYGRVLNEDWDWQDVLSDATVVVWPLADNFPTPPELAFAAVKANFKDDGADGLSVIDEMLSVNQTAWNRLETADILVRSHFARQTLRHSLQHYVVQMFKSLRASEY